MRAIPISTRAATGIVLVAALLTATGCGAGQDPTTETPPDSAAQGGPAVNIVDNRYEPETIAVGSGDTVEWTNTGRVSHTVTFEDGTDSGMILRDATYSRTFQEEGEYPYVCAIHPGMEGSVTVSG